MVVVTRMMVMTCWVITFRIDHDAVLLLRMLLLPQCPARRRDGATRWTGSGRRS